MIIYIYKNTVYVKTATTNKNMISLLFYKVVNIYLFYFLTLINLFNKRKIVQTFFFFKNQLKIIIYFLVVNTNALICHKIFPVSIVVLYLLLLHYNEEKNVYIIFNFCNAFHF